MSVRSTLIALSLAIALTTPFTQARPIPILRKPVAAGTFMQLPYSVTDSVGNQWTIYQNGMLQQRGNTPVYGQGAMLLLNNENIQMNTNRARQDEKTGEILFENGTGANLTVTRRVLVKTDDGYVRYIDVLKNAQPQDVTVDVQIQTRVNFQLQNTQTVPDPHGKDKFLAWVGQTQANRAAVEIFSGRSAKNVFNITSQPENNMVMAQMSVTVPAGKEVAIMHVHTTAANLEAGVAFATGLKETDLLKSVPTALRKLIVNFNPGLSFIGDREVLRGDLLDVIELRGGDQLKGTIKEATYTLHTFYGDVQLPSERIVGMLTTGQFRPRQLLVTGDGQVFGGRLVKETVGLELSSGQLTQIPVTQISRIGYRKRAGESDDSSLDKLLEHPMVLLRTGDRMAVAPPSGTIDFMTRYGLLKLKPENVAAVAFQSEETAVHTAFLVDGSHFAGLVAGQQFTMNLTGTAAGSATTAPVASGQSVTIPAASLARLHLTNKVADPDENTPTLQLVNGDFFVGSLSGQLKLDTLFDTITVNAVEIRTLSHARDGGADVQIELWDQSKLSGQLQEAELACALQCGEKVNVPIALIDSYNQPQPQPSSGMVEQIKAIVIDLAADDWKRRDGAEGQLVSMGPVVVGVLKQLAPTQPPEAQQRIESILKQLADRKKPATPAAATPGD